jgi:hypothetical protein
LRKVSVLRWWTTSKENDNFCNFGKNNRAFALFQPVDKVPEGTLSTGFFVELIT